MLWMRDVGLRWGLAVVYLALCLAVLALFPTFVRPFLLAIYVVYLVWTYWHLEDNYSIWYELRPLTRWDVHDYDKFRAALTAACQQVGLKREPAWAVVDDETPNARALGGRRGIVVFNTGLLRRFTPDELLAVVGHELQHLHTADGLPALIGGTWLWLISRLAQAILSSTPRTGNNVVLGIVRMFGILLDTSLLVVSWVGEMAMAKRSRYQENMADLTGARVASAGSMIGALHRLEELAGSGAKGAERFARWSPAWIAEKLYASHPPTAERIRFLQAAADRGEIVA